MSDAPDVGAATGQPGGGRLFRTITQNFRRVRPNGIRSIRGFWWTAATAPVLAWAALAAGAATPFKSSFERHAAEAIGLPVSIGGGVRVLVTPFSVHLTADEVRIANPAWAERRELVRAGTLSARFSIFELLVGRSGLRAIDMRNGAVNLERHADGKRHSWPAGTPGGWFDLAAARQVTADRVVVHYKDSRARTEGRAHLAREGRGAIRLTGTLAADRRRIKLDGHMLSFDDSPAKLDLAARSGGIAFAMRATADTPARLGQAPFHVSATGSNFSELAAFAGLQLPAMPDYALGARVSRAKGKWRVRRLEGRIGRTDLAGSLLLDRERARPALVAQLSSRALHLDDGMRLFNLRRGAATPSSPAGGGGALQAAAQRARLVPDAVLSAAALQQFDAAIDYKADRIVGVGHRAAHLSMKLALVRGVMTLSPVSVDLAQGYVSSDIMIDTRRAPVLASYDIRLSPTPMDGLIRGWAPAGTAFTARARLALTGRGATVHETLANASGRIAIVMPRTGPRINPVAAAPSFDRLKALLIGGSRPGASAVTCGVIAFTVREGVGIADPILIDTPDHVLSGSGRISLRDETVDLRLETNNKAFSLFGPPRPVLISGDLAHPVMAREPMRWLRPRSLFGLSAALADLGAIFGFVDPRPADPAACGSS